MKSQVVLFVLIIFLPSVLMSQTFTEWIGNGWGQGIDDANPAITDIDSDGLLDLFIGTYIGDIHHYEQIAVNANSFSLVQYGFNKINVGLSAAPAFADIDNDNLLDLIIGEWKGNLHHYEQISTQADSFVLITEDFSNINVGSNSSPCFADFDQDNLLDLVIGAHSGNLFLYEQESAGSDNFVLITDSMNVDPPTIRINPAVTDLDADGLLDLIIGGNFGNFSHYEQDATGSTEFVLHTSRLFENNDYIYGGSATCFIDLDNDGLLDFLVGEMDGLYYHFEQASLHSSEFAVQSDNILNLWDVGSGAAPCLTDLDNDGLWDLIVGEWHGNLNHFEQTATGALDFVHVSDTLAKFDVGDYSMPAITDLDSDGFIDLIVGNREGTLTHFEQDMSNPDEFNLIIENFNGIDLERFAAPFFTDLDGDNLIDMILGENTGKLYLYEQQTSNSLEFNLVSDSLNVESDVYLPTPYVMDYDADGLLELFVGSSNGRLCHYEQSIANSTDFSMITDNFEDINVGSKSRLAIGDINADGFEDLIIGEARGGLRLYLNNNYTDVQGSQIVRHAPERFHLYDNYPNPFNPSTTISFAIPEQTHVVIRIYNINGQEILTLLNEQKSAGQYSVEWNGKNKAGQFVPSGLYFYSIDAGDFKKARKMMLMK